MKCLFFLGLFSLFFWGLTGLFSVDASPWETQEGLNWNPYPEPSKLWVGAAVIAVITFIAFMGPWAGERRLYRAPWTLLTGALLGHLMYSLEYVPMHQYLPGIVAGSLAVWFLTMPYSILVRSAPEGMRPTLLPALKGAILGLLMAVAHISQHLELTKQQRYKVYYVLDVIDFATGRAIDWVEYVVASLLHTVGNTILVAFNASARAVAFVHRLTLKPLGSLTARAFMQLSEQAMQLVHAARAPVYARIVNPKPL